MTKFIGKTKQFKTMFELISTGLKDPLFRLVVMNVEKDYISVQTVDAANIVGTNQKHRGFEIADISEKEIPVDCVEMLDALKLFDDSAKIQIEFANSKIIISDLDDVEMKDNVSIPSVDIESVTNIGLPFKIKSGMAELKNKTTGEVLVFDIKATIPVKYLQAQIKRADYAAIAPRIFDMKFNDNDLTLLVGNPESYTKSVKTEVKIEGSGSGDLSFANGYEQIFQSLNGDVILHGKSYSPVWITKKGDNYIVQYLIAPAMVEE